MLLVNSFPLKTMLDFFDKPLYELIIFVQSFIYSFFKSASLRLLNSSALVSCIRQFIHLLIDVFAYNLFITIIIYSFFRCFPYKQVCFMVIICSINQQMCHSCILLVVFLLVCSLICPSIQIINYFFFYSFHLFFSFACNFSGVDQGFLWPGSTLCRGTCGYSPLENFDFEKLKNMFFYILGEKRFEEIYWWKYKTLINSCK